MRFVRRRAVRGLAALAKPRRPRGSPVMAISSTLSAPLRLTLTLLTLAFAACSSGSAGDDAPTDGTGQHIDDPKAGSAGAGDGGPGTGGTDGGLGPDAEGVGSSSGVPDPGSGAKGGTG